MDGPTPTSEQAAQEAAVQEMANALNAAVLTIGVTGENVPALRLLLKTTRERELASPEQIEMFEAVVDVIDEAARRLQHVTEIYNQILAEKAAAE